MPLNPSLLACNIQTKWALIHSAYTIYAQVHLEDMMDQVICYGKNMQLSFYKWQNFMIWIDGDESKKEMIWVVH